MTVTVVQRAADLLSLARQITSLDAATRSSGAEWTWARSHSGGIVQVQQAVLGQLSIWAWVIEQDTEAAEDLMRAVGTLEWVVAPSQVFGVAALLGSEARTGAEEGLLEDLDDLRERHPEAVPRLLDADACQRAIDLARGITSTDTRERLNAARLAADVAASPHLADEEASCFAGLLSYSVVIEPDPTVRHEQATVLGIAAHHGRLSDAHREVAQAGDLSEAERAGLGARS